MTVASCPLCGTGMDLAAVARGTLFSCPACGARLSQDPETGQVKVHGALAEEETVHEGRNAAWKDAVARAKAEMGEGPSPAQTCDDVDSVVELRPMGDAGTEPSEDLRIAGYEIFEMVGEGGMAVVHRARQLSLQREVALKILSPRLAQDEEFVRRFDKEARALATLSHPNIVTCFDKGQDGGHFYLSMEFIHGRSLRAEMLGGRLDRDRMLVVISEVCEALAYTHEHGVTHRDVKPENVLITDEGKVKVTDFGLAALAEEGSLGGNLTRANVMLGTVNYMPPEQRVDATAVDHRADLYAVGVMLYEMLTGRLPIGSVRMPGEEDPSLHPRIDELLRHLLEPDPADRCSSARLVIERIAEIRGGGSLAPAGKDAAVASPPRALPVIPGQERATSDIADLVAQAQRDMKRQRTKGLPTGLQIAPPARGRVMRPGCLLLPLVGLAGLVALLLWKEPQVALWIMADTKERLLGGHVDAAHFRAVEARIAQRFLARRKAYGPAVKAAMDGRAVTPRIGAMRLLARSGIPSWKWLLPLLTDPNERVRREARRALLQMAPEGAVAEVKRIAEGGSAKVSAELRHLAGALERARTEGPVRDAR